MSARKKVRELKWRLKQLGRLCQRLEEANLSLLAEAGRWRDAARAAGELAERQEAALVLAAHKIEEQAATLAAYVRIN